MVPLMSAIEQLLSLCREYGRAAGVDTTTVSWRVFGDSKKLGAIMEGADIQTRRLERAVRWFSDNWPETARWPATVARPFVKSEKKVA